MDAPCWRGGGPKAAINSRLATREPFGTPISFGFPKSARILKASDFRKVYNEGTRFAGPYFAAFCLRVLRKQGGPRLGFTVPRVFGNAVARNRARRRLREALRVRLPKIGAQWDIVINPRRLTLAATAEEIRREVDRLVERCGRR